MLDLSNDAVLWLEGERAWSILRFFGIQPGAADGKPLPVDAEHASLEVRSDPSFGPLICLVREGKPTIARITPLTDHDIREIVEIAEIPPGCGVDELLGRISQLIEELPWLCGMKAVIHRVQLAPDSCRVVLDAQIKLGFRQHEPGLQ